MPTANKRYRLPGLWERSYQWIIARLQLALWMVLSTLTLSRPSEAQPPRKLALLVGISRYDQHGPARAGAHPWRLLHAHQDVVGLRQVLIDRFGFQAVDIKVLENSDATGKGIRQAFQRHLIAQVQPGDVVFFHFSGHGQQLPDDNGDEQDGLDESLVPVEAYDSSLEVGLQVNIRDDEVGRWLAELQGRMTENGQLKGNITVTLDSCFSGTATRGIRVERGRGWDQATDGPRPLPRSLGAADGESGLLPAGQAAKRGYVLLAASRSDQPAREVQGMGVFSRALVHVLATLPPGKPTTYRALLDAIAAEMASDEPDQTPQAEGAADLLLFSDIAQPTPRLPNSLLVKREPGGLAVLQAGEVHGVTVGSRYELHPREANQLDSSSGVAAATVVSVLPFTALLQLHPPPQAAVSILWTSAIAVEKAHFFSDAPLRLHLSGMDRLPALVGQLKRLAIVTTGGGPSDYDLAIQYNPADHRLAVLRPGSPVPQGTVQLGPAAAEQLSEVLQKAWTWRYLSRLRQDRDDLRMSFRLVPTEPTDHPGTSALCTRKPIAGKPIAKGLRSGDCFLFEFHNQSSRPLFVTVLELGQDGKVEVLYPIRDDVGNNYIRASTPNQSDPQSGEVYTLIGQKPGAQSLLKLIATTQAIDFAAIFPPADSARSPTAKRAVAGSAHPLARLLSRLATGRRSASVAAQRVETADWSTFDGWLRVSN